MSYLQCKEPELFAYLAWETHCGQPVLGSEEVRQAVFRAIMTRTRTQFCRVLAIDGTPDQIYMIVRFPPSLSVSTVARMAQDAGAEAANFQLRIIQGRVLPCERIWGTDYSTHTLPQMDAAESRAYLSRQLVQKQTPRFQTLQLNF